ncbi:helix-turn-helix transcriptional regulator [Flocculibacter collagenilyticus]|uniref:helix-turn-helix transcriptional regulator n=1 Tax=Flocculibacter collagenilyticus TaxID=2744479 RepID=UPI0018F6951A|nr:response regulator transcription factor [Flocculibacter collagenilyticus]
MHDRATNLKVGEVMSLTDINTTNGFLVTTRELNLQANERLSFFLKLLQTSNINLKQQETFPNSSEAESSHWYFIDVADYDLSRRLITEIKELAAAANVVLVNAKEKDIDECMCVVHGIRGVFYQKDKPDMLMRGIECLKRHDRWYKRETMNSVINKLLTVPRTSPEQPPGRSIVESNLTKRESMIIKLISSGAKNKEIADQLNISANTVKTHIYSIFRKTQSRNRVELLTWSQRFQPSVYN